MGQPRQQAVAVLVLVLLQVYLLQSLWSACLALEMGSGQQTEALSRAPPCHPLFQYRAG
jgi:hypothetical protein